MIRNRLLQISELISILLFRYLGAWMLQTKQISDFNIASSRTHVIVSNHSGALDPFIITANLPWQSVVHLIPYKFMTANKFFNKIWLLPFLIAHGCFPAKEHRFLKYGLNYAVTLALSGRTIVIFPEGKVSKFDRAHPPKKGVEVLANIPDVQIIPARVKWNRNKGLWKSYSLSVGKPFDAKNMTADQIMDVVYALKFR